MKNFEELIGYQFKNKNLLDYALTHSSYAHRFGLKNNERLEFLGDSVLGFIVADFLVKNFENNEGILTKMRASIVSCEYLSKVITNNKLNEYIKTSPEELKFNETVKGDFFEALLGAIYLDSNFETCKNFVYNILNLNKQNITKIFGEVKDFKTLLQEKVQANKGKIEYKLLNVSGKENAKIFEMQLLINDEIICSQKASSKQKAENKCAEFALKNFANKK